MKQNPITQVKFSGCYVQGFMHKVVHLMRKVRE